MKEYAQNDFQAYYAGAFVRHPSDGRIGNLLAYDGQLYFYDGKKPIRHLSGEDILKQEVIDYRTLEWEHVRRPRLGYRHMEDGKYLFYANTMRTDQRSKGIHRNVVALDAPAEYVRAVNKLPVPYTARRSLELEEARELCNPHFVSVRHAVRMLTTNPVSVGFALSFDTAVVLGLTASETYIMLFEQQRAAVSRDGERWKIVNDVFEGAVNHYVSQ